LTQFLDAGDPMAPDEVELRVVAPVRDLDRLICGRRQGLFGRDGREMHHPPAQVPDVASDPLRE